MNNIENILKQSLNRNVRTSTGNLKKDEILNLYESKNPSLSNYRLPKLSEYFRELNYENMSMNRITRLHPGRSSVKN